MPGYLDEFGVKDAQRERRNKRVIIGGLIAVILGTSAFFYFRTWSQERIVDRFFALLKEQKYQDAYRMWQTPESARFYPPEKFTEDWGPTGGYKNPSALRVDEVDSCGQGVVFDVAYPGSDNFGLWVERGSGIISFAPWPRCPGAHLQIWRFLKSRFGG
jgi:hypothetical protein